MMLVRRNYQPTFNSLVDEFLKNDMSDRLDCNHNFAQPKTNIIETEKTFVIEMLVPGFKKKDLKINVEDNLLTVSVEKEEKKEESSNKTFFREFEINNFKRSFRLSHKVDKENIEANFNNGILSISVPKLEEAYVKKMIEVK